MNGRWIDQFPPEREYDLEIDEDTYELQMADTEVAQEAAARAEAAAAIAIEKAADISDEVNQAIEGARVATQKAAEAGSYADGAEVSARVAVQNKNEAEQAKNLAVTAKNDTQAIKEEVEQIIEGIDEAGTAADASAQAAAQNASDAANSATAAADSASAAAESAESAAEKAEIADDCAERSLQHVEDIQVMMTDTMESMFIAQGKAREAATSATNASNSATAASGSASQAAQAKTDAETARDKAVEAAQNAQAAADIASDTQNMIATVETTEIASKDYAINDLLIYEGVLYKVSNTITLGDTLIPNSNIEETTVEESINNAVPSWAKASTKPSYTASEVGAPTVQEMNTAIGTAISNINSFDMAVVQTLPSENISTHTIYLVPKTGETNDVYDEYIYINNAWEMVGNTQIDLSNYALKSEIPDVPVEDVQINGTSIINNGIAEIPVRSNVVGGSNDLVTSHGINNTLTGIISTSLSQIKDGSIKTRLISPSNQHQAAFYGLAKAAGHDEKDSTLPAGQYTDEAKAAIQTMLNVPDKSYVDSKTTAIYETVGPSAIASFADGADNMPLKSLVVDIPVTQSGSGDPSPENVRPFIGRTGLTLHDTRKNLVDWDEFVKFKDKTWFGMTMNYSDGVYSMTGTATANRAFRLGSPDTIGASFYTTLSLIAASSVLLPAGRYKCSTRVIYGTDLGEKYSSPNNGTAAPNTVFELTQASWVMPVMSFSNGNTYDVHEQLMLWKADENDTYEPYEGRTVEIPFTAEAGTVYAGTLDVTAGTLTVDRVIAKKLWSELTSPTVYTNTTRKLYVKPTEYRGNNERKTLSNIAKDVGGTSEDFAHINTYSNGSNIYVFMPNGTADDTTIELCYLIGTPIVIQLDPVAVSTILGTNNIWADAGNVTVEYPVNAMGYVDTQMAALFGQIDTLTDDVDALEAAQPKTITITGTTPVITALPGIRYVCGEVATLDITLPASGCIDVIFESGSTPTVLTVTPPTGVTLRWANGFDPTSLDANTVYEINILDGLGVAMTWT